MSDQPSRGPAVAQGGPLDGTTLGDDSAQEYLAAMADGSRHRYVRTERRVDRGRLYDYVGRT